MGASEALRRELLVGNDEPRAIVAVELVHDLARNAHVAAGAMAADGGQNGDGGAIRD